MKIVKNTLQKLSLGGFYVTYMLATNAQSAFALTKEQCADLEGGIRGGVECAIGEESSANTNLFGDGGLFERVINILLFLVGAISVVMLIVGGIRYVISAGDQNAVTAAKNTILYAVIGLVISFLAYGIVNFLVDSLT